MTLLPARPFLLAAVLSLATPACAQQPAPASADAGNNVAQAAEPAVVNYGYRVVGTYPHDQRAFTQGLFYLNGHLYESTGQVGQSTIRKVHFEDGRVLPNFLCQAIKGEPLTIYGDGSQTRSFCYVDDLVDGVWRLMRAEESMPVNIGNPDEMTIRQFADRILAATGSRSPLVTRPLPTDDPKVRCPDITRARTLLGWSPKVTLAEGLEKTVRDFRARGKLTLVVVDRDSCATCDGTIDRFDREAFLIAGRCRACEAELADN